MHERKSTILSFSLCLCALLANVVLATPTPASAQAASPVVKSLGIIKTMNGSALTLAPESGPEVTANVQPNARILRLAPGEKDLKSATPITLQDLQVGDTVRVRGYASQDGKSIATLEVIVITKAAVAAVGDQIRQDWQKRGLGGLVEAVDPPAGTVTISTTSFSGKKNITVHTAKSTIIRRYAPDSVKFEDAKPSTLAEIHPGDQLRARGDKNADGTEVTAEEIVSGSFRNVAGTVNTADASAGTLTVQDLLSKKTVQVKITSESQLHQLPPEMARMIAMRIKGAMPPGMPGAAAGSGASASSSPAAGSAGAGQGAGQGTSGGTRPGGGAPDFQRMLSRMPTVALSDLHKGDAVMIVTTPGSESNPGTAITLLSGVEPILQAAPSASQAAMLTPWSLGGGMPGGGDQ
ncbi:MAG: DUF5666 domain-containing protein [Candidatus Sulfotelmatobacter sp.]